MADPEQAFYRSEDSPSVRAEMRGQMQRLRSTEGHVAAFAANAAEVGTALTGGGLNSTPVERLLTAAELAQVDVGNTLFQLRDFADNFAHQVDHNVVGPLRDYHASIGQAMKLARAFDEDSEALDSAHLKYLSLSRDCATEARAHAHSDLCDKAAGVNLSLFDARAQLKEACAAQRMVPQRAVSQLLLAQLAYHQSCARLLTSIMPQISDLMARADAAGRGVAAERESSKEQRATMPQPQVREGVTQLEGWLFKGPFNLTRDDPADSVKGQALSRFKPWNKRWFVLSDDGRGHAKLYYYKSPEDSKVAKVPIDMNLLSSVAAVNGPLELELKLGPRTLRLKALDQADRDRWMETLLAHISSHGAEREAAAELNARRYEQRGRGIRDIDQKASTHSLTSAQGWVYRQDADLLRRWRKWWCVVGEDELTCTSYESLKVSETPREHSSSSSSSMGGSRLARAVHRDRGDSRAAAAAAASPPLVGGNAAESDEPVACRVAHSVSLPLATVNVRESRGASVPFVFEVISPQQTVVLQAQSQEEMGMWIEVIQNATSVSLGMAVRTPSWKDDRKGGSTSSRCSNSVSRSGTVWARVRMTPGNDQCADCGQPNPAWASINLGVVVCLACSGVHRQIGVHISKVRSLELDVISWSSALVGMMSSLGNTALNEIWQPAVDGKGAGEGGGVVRLAADATAPQREAYIRRKYEARGFTRGEEGRPANGSLHVAASRDDALLAARCLVHGFEFDALAPESSTGEWSEEDARVHAGRSALHVAAASGSEEVLEMLLQNLAGSTEGVDYGDRLGKSALKLAVEAKHDGCVQQLLTRDANISCTDAQQQTPMQAAAELGYDEISEAMLKYKLAQDEKLLRQIEVE